MTVGLPGVGLGGIFYLASAICMPFRAVLRRTGEARHGRIVVRQTLLAAGILVALWATGWALGDLITMTSRAAPAMTRGVPIGVGANAVRVSALLLSLGTLSIVLLSVEVARFAVKVRDARRNKQLPAPAASAEALRVDSGTFGRVR